MRLIVGFEKRLVDLDDLKGFSSVEDRALYELKRAPPPGFVGLIGIVRRINHTNAVYVDIDAASLDEFLRACKSWDPVAYCDQNHAIAPCSYSTTVPLAYKLGVELRETLAQEHLPAPVTADPFGLGIRIGMIDTGLAPHPYLPALSTRELREKTSTFHSTIPKADRRRLCDRIEACEHAAGVDGIGLPVAAGAPPAAGTYGTPLSLNRSSGLALLVGSELDAYADERWASWKMDVGEWLSRQRRAPRPVLPVYRHLAGALRLVSPHSRNFVAEFASHGVLDAHGHGTSMAGVISALRPTMSQADPLRQLSGQGDHPLMEPVVGLCPFAELVVLKCFHRLVSGDESMVNGALFHMVDALEYALDLNLNVLYIGLAAYDIGYQSAQTVSGLIGELQAKGTVVIAPAGNDGVTKAELAFPAAAGGVKAITAVARDPNSGGLELCPYSSYASKTFRQRVAFCAMGGVETAPIVTTYRGSGFTGVRGTSVAAAIATAVFSTSASGLYHKRVNSEYDIQINTSGQIDADLIKAQIQQWMESATDQAALWDAVEKAGRSVHGSSPKNPSERFGVGIIRGIDRIHLP